MRLAGFAASYQQPGSEAFTLTVSRGVRAPDDAEADSSYIRIWALPQSFPPGVTPASGDTVTIDDVAYVVHSINPDKDPESDAVNIYLSRRAPTNGSLWSTPTVS